MTTRSRAIGQHVMMRLVSSQVLATTVATRRRAARILHEEGARRGLLAFRVVDTHAHALLIGTSRDAARFAQYAEQRMRWHLALPAPFQRAHVVGVDSQSHLERTFRYVLRQEEHHRAALDLRHEASSAPDLLGLRVIAPGLPERVHTALPRVDARDVVAWLGIELGEPQYEGLADAAAAALALPHLDDRAAPSVLARTAAVHAAKDLSTGELAELLCITRRSVERLRHRAVPGPLVEAVRRQLRLRVERRSPFSFD